MLCSRLTLPTITLAAALFAPAALAADASRWDGDARSGARLIAGHQHLDTGLQRAGVELRLKAGWITYWRYPGDAGVPPHFDFSGSTNLRSVDVLWPAPKRIEKDGVESIGYDAGVVFPLRVTAQDPAKPVTLRLKLDYGVCEKLCVPAEANVELALDGSASSTEPILAAAERMVPQPVPMGPRDGLAITAIRRDGNRVMVSVAAGTRDLFVEGPTSDWAFPLPKQAGGSEQPHFSFVLDGAPPGADYTGTEIKLTATGDGPPIEVKARLD